MATFAVLLRHIPLRTFRIKVSFLTVCMELQSKGKAKPKMGRHALFLPPPYLTPPLSPYRQLLGPCDL